MLKRNSENQEESSTAQELFESIKIIPYKVFKTSLFNKKSEKFINASKESLDLMDKKFNMSYEIEYIPLEKLNPFPQVDIKFNTYTEDDENNLDESIKTYGLFSPIIVWKINSEQNYILSGVERYSSYIRLFLEASENDNEEGMLLYENIPCYTIEGDEIDDLKARDIMIDANLCSRRMDPISFSNAIANKIAIKIAEKNRRESLFRDANIVPTDKMNIMDEISSEMMRSKPTLYSYYK